MLYFSPIMFAPYLNVVFECSLSFSFNVRSTHERFYPPGLIIKRPNHPDFQRVKDFCIPQKSKPDAPCKRLAEPNIHSHPIYLAESEGTSVIIIGVPRIGSRARIGCAVSFDHH